MYIFPSLLISQFYVCSFIIQGITFFNTILLSYPSGRVAICAIYPGANITGRYTIVYGDSVDSPMLAIFVPAGQGCCYHKNGSIR